jgi:hypothetical protein
MVNLPNLFKYLPSLFNTFNCRLALIEWFSCNQMKANPDKCQALAIGKHSMDTNIAFDLAGNKIRCKNEAKLLTTLSILSSACARVFSFA